MGVASMALILAIGWPLADQACLSKANVTQGSFVAKYTQEGSRRLPFAGTPEAVREVLVDWEQSCTPVATGGQTWKSIARFRIALTFAFITAYCLLAFFIVQIIRQRTRQSLMRMYGLLISYFVLVAGVMGVISSLIALWLLSDYKRLDVSWMPGLLHNWSPAIARLFAILQLGLLVCIVLYLIMGIPRELNKQSRRRTNFLYKRPPADEPHSIIDSVPTRSADLQGAIDEAAVLSQVVDAELDHIRHHRHPTRTKAESNALMVGLAISGGGIRAATTGLGALQALARLKILPLVDYVSSVSGGGYIASALSSLTTLNGRLLPETPVRTKNLVANKSQANRMEQAVAARATAAAANQPATNQPAAVRAPDRTAETKDEDLLDPHVFTDGDRPGFGTNWNDFPFRDDNDQSPAAERAVGLIAHLRTHGSFLIARRGILSRDTLRAIGNVLTGITFNVGGFLLVLFATSTLYLMAVFALSPGIDAALIYKVAPTNPQTALPPRFGVLDSTSVREYATPCELRADCVTKSSSTLRSPSLREWIAFELYTLTLAPQRAIRSVVIDSALPPQVKDSLRAVSREHRRMSWSLLAAVAVGVFATFLALGSLMLALSVFRDKGVLAEPLPGEAEEDVFDKAFLWFQGMITLVLVVFATVVWAQRGLAIENRMVGLWLPLAALIGARVTGFWIAAVFPNVLFRSHWTRRFRTLWGGFQASVVYGLWFSVLFALLAPLMFAVAGHGVALATGGAVSLLAARLLTRTGGTKSKSPKLPKGLLHFLLGLAVMLAVILGILFFGSVLITYVNPNNYWLFAVVAIVAIAAIGFLVDMNKLSLHYFYRDRLAETYLFSELPDTNRRQWTYRDSMELPLRRLHGDGIYRADKPVGHTPEWRNPAPYHLISAAINLAGSRDLTRKDRKSGYWLFSKLYCGSTHTGFRPTAVYRAGDTKLARAMAVSGAAASTGMGFHTFFAQAFATALFNVRLGYWTENPHYARSQNRREGGLFWPAYLWREVTMQTNDQTFLVNLSDGGHTGDNIGIYPLLQRRCKVVIAIDAEQDAGLAFGSFTEAIRHAYVDEGIRVDIDMSMIRPDPDTGYSRNHCAVGRILYPDRPDQVSWLIYLKNSLTGDEPEPVLNYKADEAPFPHESTGDQFFTDAQFESYRSLGDHIANSVFGKWVGDDPFSWAVDVHSPRPKPERTP